MQALSQQLIDALNKLIEWIYSSFVSEFLDADLQAFSLYPQRILPLVPFAFFNGFRPKVRPGMAAVGDLEFGTPVVLFVRQNRRSARGREREGQANEAARMVPVRCHEDSLTLRFRRCQIPVTFTLICFGNELLRTFTKKVDTCIGTNLPLRSDLP